MDSYLSHLSDQTHRILARANEEARRLDDEYVGTQHVLLAFLHDETSRIAAVLDRLGVKFDAVRREIEKLFPAVRSPLRVGVLPRTPRVRRIIQEAFAEARYRGENCQVRPDELLLCLLRDEESTAAAILSCLGMRPADICALATAELTFPHGITTTPAPPRLVEPGDDSLRRAEEVDHLQVGAPADDTEGMRLSLPAIERPLVRGPRARFWAFALRLLNIAFPLADFLEEEPTARSPRHRRVGPPPAARAQRNRIVRPRRDIEARLGFAAIMARARFSDRARNVLQLANQEAQRLNHEYIGTERLLLGLIKGGELDAAAKVLRSLDLDLRVVRMEVEKIVGAGDDVATVGKLPPTPGASRVVERAIEEACYLRQDPVDTEHLLLGLLLVEEVEEGVAAQVLRNLGVSAGMVRAKLLARLGKGG